MCVIINHFWILWLAAILILRDCPSPTYTSDSYLANCDIKRDTFLPLCLGLWLLVMDYQQLHKNCITCCPQCNNMYFIWEKECLPPVHYVSLNVLGDYVIFPTKKMWHHGYYNKDIKKYLLFHNFLYSQQWCWDTLFVAWEC